MQEQAQLHLYVDLMSQPSRALVIFCKCTGIPFVQHVVNLGKGEQRTKEYLTINPLGKVPFATFSNGFSLPESSAILRYLAGTNPSMSDNWLPADDCQRARVDAAMAWNMSILRDGAAKLCFNRVIGPSRGLPANAAVAANAEAAIRRALTDLDGVWLGDSKRWVAGGSAPSAADLLMACELEQLRLLDGALEGPTMEELLEPHPRVRQWISDVQKALSPHYADAHVLLGKAAQWFKQLKQQRGNVRSRM